eukprot:jgi/Psemu1/301502/fgenesh1_kg.36_\
MIMQSLELDQKDYLPIMVLPLRSGDTLFFNPLVLHSCLNPKYEGCYIMSAYVSRKTVLRSNQL